MTAPDTWRIENNDASTLYDFLASDSLRPEEGSQFTEVLDDGVVIETFNLIKKDSAIANLRSEVVELEGLLEEAVRWHRDNRRRDPYWYRWVTSGESDKRSLIYNYILRHAQHDVMNPNLNGSAAYLQLALTRHRAFEELTAATASVSALDGFGGVWNISGDIAGGVLDGRIAKLRLVPSGSGQIIDSIWIGMRPIRDGISTFSPLIDINGSTVSGGYLGTALVVGDSATFSSVLNTWNGATADWQDYIGRYLVLARYKYSNDSTRHSVKLQYSLGAYVAGELETQYPIGGESNWHLQPLGEIEIVPGRMIDEMYTDYPPSDFRLQLDAERVDGAGDLNIDALCLVPAEHQFSVVTDTSSAMSLFEDYPIQVYTHPDDRVDAYSVNDQFNTTRFQVPGSSVNWRYPTEGAALVCFSDRQPGFAHKMAINVDIDIEVYKRWPTYRD